MAGYKWLEIPEVYSNIVKDKKKSANAYYRYFLARLSRMFEYKNLPDTIPHEILDRYLMNNGIALITKVDDKLYCFYGNLGGPQDVYYRPTEFIVSNPHIKAENGELFTANIPICPFSDTPVDVGQPITQQGVLIRNDTEWIGLAPMLSRYSYLMAENILTLRTADVMLRITSLLTAPSDKERLAALEYLKSLEKGELGVIGESPFFDGVRLQSPPSNNGSYLTQFIEYQQYLKGSIFNELGLVANYNMKREAIGKGESTLDQDAIMPLVDNMLLCRQEDMKRVNEMYDTDIEVSFSSAWLENLIETKSSLISMGQPTGLGFGQSGAPNTEENNSNSGQSGAPNPDKFNSDQSGADGAQDAQNPVGQPTTDDGGEMDNNGADGADRLDGSDGTDGTTDNPESKINDTASEGFLEQLNDQLEDKLDKLDKMDITDPVGQPTEKGDENVIPRDTEGSEDKEDNSDD